MSPLLEVEDVHVRYRSGNRLVAAVTGKPDGIEHLGGIDFDHAVFRHVLASVGVDPDTLDPDDPALSSAMAQLRQACVEAKEGLSSDTDVAIPVMLPRHHSEVRLTRVEFEDMVRPALRETIVAMRVRALQLGQVRQQLVAVSAAFVAAIALAPLANSHFWLRN